MNKSKIAFLLVMSAGLMRAQGISEALTTFPSTTELIEYDNLSALRFLPAYEQLRSRFAAKPLEEAKLALSKLGIDETAVDSVIIGTAGTEVYGVASGTFSAVEAGLTAARHRVLPIQVEDAQVFCPGAGVCLTFLEDWTVAFGTPAQLRTMLQARLGLVSALNRNSDLVNLMRRLPANGMVQGIAIGREIRPLAASALTDTGLPFDWSLLTSNISAFSYSIEMDSKAHIAMLLKCNSPAMAFLLKNILGLLGAGRTPSANIEKLESSTDGRDLELKMDTTLPVN